MNGSTCASPWVPCSYFKKNNLTCSISKFEKCKSCVKTSSFGTPTMAMLECRKRVLAF